LFSLPKQKGQTITRRGGAVALPDYQQSLVDTINQMTREDWLKVPGIGEKTADNILKAREKQAFFFAEDLRTVQGIGEKRLDAIIQTIHSNK
jgi:competence ComEA-like helix-hairpin-helix protein